MIIGTAGHIDHGKTTLVRALTGVDTDRLPEERQRGVSIELGYAFLDDLKGGRIGFIDVPGHERLVHTMLSGATGIDHALLLVAADDGVMPQTREHLAVLSLLGLASGTVAVTKIDRAESVRVQEVVDQTRALLQGTPLHEAPVLTLSAQTGQGVEELRQRLLELAAAHVRRRDDVLGFRLAVDRSFTIKGVGTVVTGTVHAGCVKVGQELCLLPGGKTLRVRSVHAQNAQAEQAVLGQRCALALAGVDKDEVPRGAWLCDPAVALQTERLDVVLTVWREEAKSLRPGQAVHVHLGAEQVTGSLALLDAESVAPGSSALCQLVLRRPIGAWYGDRVVLRDAAGSRTLAGGTVLDPAAPARYRRTPARLTLLEGLRSDDARERWQVALQHADHGLDATGFARSQGCLDVPPYVLRDEQVLDVSDGASRGLMRRSAEEALRLRVLAALDAYHTAQPDEMGPDTARLRRLAAPRVRDAVWKALMRRWSASGEVAVRGAFVHRPSHGVKLSQTEERLSQKAAPLLQAAGFEGAWVRDLARDAQESEPLMRVTLARLAQQGRLHQVVRDLYYPHETMVRLVGIAHGVAQRAGGEVTAASFRDATGLGRKRAIQVLEYQDRVGVLRRIGDLHRLRPDSALLASCLQEQGLAT